MSAAMSIALHNLFGGVRGAAIDGDTSASITGLAYHSARVQPGFAFFAIQGFREDGARYIADALSKGAAAVVAEGPRASAPQHIAWVQVPSARPALALAACEFYRHPSHELSLVGVTGTNGKTTTAFLIASILEAAGMAPALSGTIENRVRFADHSRAAGAQQTTPESLDLQAWLRQVVEQGGRSAVMEVSSHSLVLSRVAGARFHTAVWTNFARDHLDFHPTVDEYFAAKKKLFLPLEEGGLAPEFAVLNAEDARYQEMTAAVKAQVISFGLEARADVFARRWKTTADGIELLAQLPQEQVEIRSRLVGRHNVSNILAALAAASTLGVEPAAMRRGVAEVRVPGRLEPIQEGQSFTVLVDYAHTEDALRSAVQAAREMTGEGMLIVVFGCGGDRDRSKRPAMGQAAAAADRVILTSDNPRTEDPLQILNDVQVGLQKAGAVYAMEAERAAAIRRALGEARAGDTVLIAGKGHENYQIIGVQRFPFDDRDVARRILREMQQEASQ